MCQDWPKRISAPHTLTPKLTPPNVLYWKRYYAKKLFYRLCCVLFAKRMGLSLYIRVRECAFFSAWLNFAEVFLCTSSTSFFPQLFYVRYVQCGSFNNSEWLFLWKANKMVSFQVFFVVGLSLSRSPSISIRSLHLSGLPSLSHSIRFSFRKKTMEHTLNVEKKKRNCSRAIVHASQQRQPTSAEFIGDHWHNVTFSIKNAAKCDNKIF